MTTNGKDPRRSVADRVNESAVMLRSGPNTERTVFFSDAVFAIAMTLLVLDLRLPELPGPVDAATFNEAVFAKVPGFISFALSFALVGVTWIYHHRRFAAIVRYDSRLQQLNLVLLFLVAFMPVPTGMLFADNGGSPLPVVLYAITIAAIYLMLSVIWMHARRADLLDPRVSDALYRYSQHATIPVISVFLLSVPLTSFSVDVARYAWLAILPWSVLQGIYSRRRFVTAESARFRAEDRAAGASPDGRRMAE